MVGSEVGGSWGPELGGPEVGGPEVCGPEVMGIRGPNVLALDLITIGSFVSRLSDNNRLLELSMRDYPLDETGLRGLLPCLPLGMYVLGGWAGSGNIRK